MEQYNRKLSYLIAVLFSAPYSFLVVFVLTYIFNIMFATMPAGAFILIALLGFFLCAAHTSMIAGLKFNLAAISLGVIVGGLPLLSNFEILSEPYFLLVPMFLVSVQTIFLIGIGTDSFKNADFILLIHTLQIIFVLAAVVLSVWEWPLRPFIAALAIGTFLMWRYLGGCPLTFLEQELRYLRGEKINLKKDGCIAFYLKRWFGLNFSGRQIEIFTLILTGLLFLCWGIDYAINI